MKVSRSFSKHTLTLFFFIFATASIASGVSCNSGDTEVSSGTESGQGTGVGLSENAACVNARSEAADNLSGAIDFQNANCVVYHDYYKNGTASEGTCMCDEERGWTCTVANAQQDWVCCDAGTR